jgi:PKHD-type hydroxylase
MAYQSIWYNTDLSKEIVDILEKDAVENFGDQLQNSQLLFGKTNKNIRNSKNSWIPTSHWIGGFLWHYIQRANRENFLYDLTNIDGEKIQFTYYDAGDYYHWHNDAGLSLCRKPTSVGNSDIQNVADDFIHKNCESIRKLSIVVQLSDPDEYEGGNLQIMDERGKSYIAPRTKGTIIIFDSRSQHRVLKVKSGLRKSLVAWVVGPRWR